MISHASWRCKTETRPDLSGDRQSSLCATDENPRDARGKIRSVFDEEQFQSPQGRCCLWYGRDTGTMSIDAAPVICKNTSRYAKILMLKCSKILPPITPPAAATYPTTAVPRASA